MQEKMLWLTFLRRFSENEGATSRIIEKATFLERFTPNANWKALDKPFLLFLQPQVTLFIYFTWTCNFYSAARDQCLRITLTLRTNCVTCGAFAMQSKDRNKLFTANKSKYLKKNRAESHCAFAIRCKLAVITLSSSYRFWGHQKWNDGQYVLFLGSVHMEFNHAYCSIV